MPDGPDGTPGPGFGTDRAGTPPARLKLRPDFLRVATGGRVHARSLSLQVYRRRPEDAAIAGPRVGLTVTKKVGNAVERNRIKRRLRDALRDPGLPAAPDHDYVIVARRDALSVPFSGLTADLKRCLADAGKGRARKPGPRRGPASPRGAGEPRVPVRQQ